MGNTMLMTGYTLMVGLTSFQRADIRPLEALGRRVEPAQQQSPKPDFIRSIGQWFYAHGPANQTGANKKPCAFPSNDTRPAHFPAGHPRIFYVLRRAFVFSW